MPSQVDASLMRTRSLLIPNPSYKATNLFAFSTLAFLLKDNLASTSVETLPGIIFKISLPNRTHVTSRAASTCSARVLKNKNSILKNVQVAITRSLERQIFTLTQVYLRSGLFAVFDSLLDQVSVFLLISSRENKRGIRGCVRGLKLLHGCK